MITIKQVKEDLNNIKYYYSRKKSMDEAFKNIGYNRIIKTVEKYNEMIKDANPKFYDLYSQLYVNNHTQESLADYLGYTREFINMQNKKLVLFFQCKLNEQLEGGE